MNRKYFWKIAIYIFMLFEKFFKNVCLAYSQSLVMSPKFFDDQPLLHRKKYSGTWPIFAYLWLVCGIKILSMIIIKLDLLWL